MKHSQDRRTFIKNSVTGLGAFGMVNANQLVQQRPGLKVICIGAHPGDPEFGCGGTMARYVDAGHAVTFFYLTRGEASDPGRSHQEMARTRTQEAEAACALLKVKSRYIGQVDGATVLNDEAVAKVKALITEEKPDVVFTQWPMDSHRDHQVAGLLALNAWTHLNRNFHLYFYEVNTGSETMSFVPTDYVDITGTRKRKIDALMCHKSQDPENVYKEYFEPLETFRGLESMTKAAEAFIHYKPFMRSDTIGLGT